MYDFHVHTYYSLDSKSSMLSMVEAAIDNGIKGVCFTDHLDIDFPGEKDYQFRYDLYIKELQSERESHGKKIELFTGIELGLQPHVLERTANFLEGKKFDYIMGSIHAVGKKDMYSGDFIKNSTDRQGIIDYFNDMINCIDNFDDFDVLGHIDGIRRYLKSREDGFRFDDHKKIIASVLEKIIKKGKGIEVNTSGIRYKLSSVHPIPEILSLYKSLGGKIITLGSDSHKPEYVGYYFEETMEMLKELGFEYYCIFRDRKPEFLKIEV